MSIFDFFGIGKKKEVAPTVAGANILLEETKKTTPSRQTPVATTWAWSVAEVAPAPKIDFFAPKTKVAEVKEMWKIGAGEVNTEIPKIDMLWEKSAEPATKQYDWFIGSVMQQGSKALQQMWYQTVEHFLRKISPTEDMVNMVPEKYKWVVREHFEQKFPDTTYKKLQEKDAELMKNPEFTSKFDKWIVTAIKDKDRKTLSNPEFWWEVIGQWLWGSVPSLAIAIATKNPSLATMAFFPQMEQDAYEDISTDKDTSGLPEWVKEWYALTVGALNTVIEWVGMNFLTKPFLRAMKKEIVGEVLKSPLKAWIKSAFETLGSEGMEEVMQQLTSDVFAKLFWSQRNLPSLEQLWNIFASASFGVWPMAIAGWATEFNTQSNINKEIMAKPVEGGEKFQEQLPQDVIEWIKKEKWLSAQDIMQKYPDIQLKKDIPVTDIHGNKSVIDAGEALTPYEIKGNKILLQDGQTYIVSKNQYQNIKNQSVSWEAKNFAPELEGTEETILWARNIVSDIDMWKEWAYESLPQNVRDAIENTPWADEGDYDALRILSKKLKDIWREQEYDLDWTVTSLHKISEWSPTKYSQYTLPWWENYKEVLMQAPIPKKVLPELNWKEQIKWEQRETTYKDSDYHITKYDGNTYSVSEFPKDWEIWHSFAKMSTLEMAKFRVAELVWDLRVPKAPTFKSSHREQKNVLSHLRMNEREYNWKKVTFMEELQSDRAREARKQWPVTALDTPLKWYKWEDWNLSMTRDWRLFWIDKEWDWFYVYEKDAILWQKVGSIEEWKQIIEKELDKPKIPTHPLLENRQETAVKRALREAVQNWSEYFSWINWEQTANRYSLEKQINWVERWDGSKYRWWLIKPNETRVLLKTKSSWDIVFYIDEKWTITFTQWEWISSWMDKNIADVIWKWLAEKIMASKEWSIEWEWLKIWWERAYNLYDKQIPNIVKKLTGKTPEKIDLGLSASDKNEIRVVKSNEWMTYKQKLTQEDIKVWQEIDINWTQQIITKDLWDGNFWTVYKDAFRSHANAHSNIGNYAIQNWYIKNWEVISDKMYKDPQMIAMIALRSEMKFGIDKPSIQRSIKLTPDVVARVKWQSPLTKQPSGKQPFLQTEPSLLEVKFQDEEIARDQEIKKATQEDIDKAKALLPEASFRTVEQIINPKTWITAYWSYIDGMITFAKTMTKTTAYHEVFHGYFDMFVDQKNQRAILEIVKKEQNIDNDLEAEERLAEKFAENAIAVENGTDIKGNYKILDFLDKLRATVKSVFGEWDKIKQLYNDIMTGKRPGGEQINTPEFKRWFGDSKVVDEDGKPLVVYHWTINEFDEFNLWKWRNEASGIGNWFVDKKFVADTFANTEIVQYYYTDKKTGEEIVVWEKTDWWGWLNKDWKYPETMSAPTPNWEDINYRVTKRPKVIDTFLSIKNPKVFESSEDGKIDSFELMMDDRDEVTWATYMVGDKRSDMWAPYQDRYKTSQEYKDHLKSQGYDGIILKNTEYDGDGEKSDQFVTFEPTQIKSATENRGTFDPYDARIRYQEKVETDAEKRKLQKKINEKSDLDKLLEDMDPIEDKDYTRKGKEYLDKVEPTLKEIEEITAETTNFRTMTDKELDKFYSSGRYDKLSDFEQNEFDNIMNKRVFVDPMQFADPERQRFIDRIAKLEAREQRIGKVGKNKVSKEKSHQQSIEVDRERESIIEDIQAHYQFESTNDAYDMYAQLRDVPISQIKYEPRKWEYVSKAEKQRRVEKRVDKMRNETPQEKERRVSSIMWNVMTQARERGNQVTEVKAMMTMLDVKKWEMPPPLVKENNLSEDFYNNNKLSEKERKEVLKSKVSADVKQWALNRWSRYIKPIGTQLEEISKSAYARVKKYDYDVVIKWQQDMQEALPFLEWITKLKKENIDEYFSLWLALSNRDIAKAKSIMEQYSIEFPKKLLEKIYNEWEDAWFDIGHLEDYFPRVVKDSKWLIGALRKSPERTYIEDAIRRIEQMREEKLTIEEEWEIINALLLGRSVDWVMIWSPNMKERSIELVKKDLLQYYYPPEQALTKYLGSMRDAIEVGKLFGNSWEFDTSLWLFIAQEVADWKIAYEDAEKVRELLEAKFEKTKTNPFINWMKTVWYSASLGSFSSTITQLWDLSFSFIENGVAKTLKAYGKSIAGKSELKTWEFGIDDIWQEFRWEWIAKKILSTILKWTWFSWMDKRGKETYINSTFSELKSLAKKNDVALSRDLAEYYWESKAKQIMKDLKEWKSTDDVRTYIFLKLCNIQPLTSTEMPIGYHKNPVFYMLKSFALKQIDYITKKWIKYAIANPKKGIPRLARIMFFIMMMNGLSDELKNITLGRKYNSVFYRLLNGEDVWSALSWLFWDNFFKMFWLTKYSIYEAKTDGIDKAFTNIFLSIPPLQVPGNIISDLMWAINGKTSFEDLKSVQMIPWVGKPMYRWVGKWQASQQKSLKSEVTKQEKSSKTSSVRVSKTKASKSSKEDVKRTRK